MDLKVYRFVAHFGAASDGGVISWARRPRCGLARPLARVSASLVVRTAVGAFGPLQLNIRVCVPSTVSPMAYDVSLPIRRRTIGIPRQFH